MRHIVHQLDISALHQRLHRLQVRIVGADLPFFSRTEPQKLVPRESEILSGRSVLFTIVFM